MGQERDVLAAHQVCLKEVHKRLNCPGSGAKMNERTLKHAAKVKNLHTNGSRFLQVRVVTT